MKGTLYTLNHTAGPSLAMFCGECSLMAFFLILGCEIKIPFLVTVKPRHPKKMPSYKFLCCLYPIYIVNLTFLISKSNDNDTYLYQKPHLVSSCNKNEQKKSPQRPLTATETISSLSWNFQHKARRTCCVQGTNQRAEKTEFFPLTS